MSKEWWLRGRRKAKRSYSTFKVRRSSHEETPLVQSKEQWLHFAGTAVKSAQGRGRTAPRVIII